MKINGVRSLWGQEFKVVKYGLAEEEVTAFVTDLVSQRDSLLERQQNLNSLQMLAEKTVTGATGLADEIKQEAQGKAARVIELAEERAREITAEAQGQAEKIIAEANEYIKNMKQEAQGKAARVIELAEERARGITSEGRKEVEKLVAEANELADSVKQKAQNQAAKVIGEAEEKAQEEVAKILKETGQEVVAIIEAAERQVSTEINNICDRFLPRVENTIAETRAADKETGQARVGAVAENEPGSLPLSIPNAEASNNGEKESLRVCGNLKSKLATMVASKVEAIDESTAISAADKSATADSPQEDSVLFEKEVEIAVAPPVDTTQLTRLTRKLQDVSHLKILRTDGRWDEGNVISAHMDRPLPLISLLMGMPEVEKAQLWTGREKRTGGYFPWWIALEPKPGGLKQNRLLVVLRNNPK